MKLHSTLYLSTNFTTNFLHIFSFFHRWFAKFFILNHRYFDFLAGIYRSPAVICIPALVIEYKWQIVIWHRYPYSIRNKSLCTIYQKCAKKWKNGFKTFLCTPDLAFKLNHDKLRANLIQSRHQFFIERYFNGASCMAEHGNWPIFATEFVKIVYFGGLRKTGILSDTEILYFEGPNTAKFQSYGHWYCLNSSLGLCPGVNDMLVPKSDQ